VSFSLPAKPPTSLIPSWQVSSFVMTCVSKSHHHQCEKSSKRGKIHISWK
jgi:hypothetical protein